jgi:phosphatidylglycerophosphate synthase
VSGPTLRQIRDLGQKGANEPFTLGRVYGSRLSRYATWLLARTPLGPDGVTGLGVGTGLLAGALLLVPLGAIHLLSVFLYQLSYVLDFSDGEIARLRGRSSEAGSYLDWVGHFYVPTLGAAFLGIQVAAAAGPGLGTIWLVAGVLAAIGLASFHASCKEHIVVAYLRRHPEDVATQAVQNALLDHPSPVLESPGQPGSVTPRRRQPILSLLGALLLYPGAMHLLSLSLAADLATGAMTGAPVAYARAGLLGAWAIAFIGHGLLAIQRNHRVLRHLDALHGAELPWAVPGAAAGSVTEVAASADAAASSRAPGAGAPPGA